MNDTFTSPSAAPQPPPAPAAYAPPPVVHTVVVDRKSPALAGFLSMFPASATCIWASTPGRSPSAAPSRWESC